MTIREYFNGMESNTLASKEEAVQSAMEWISILQEEKAEEHSRGQQSYRSDLVQMAETIHSLNTGVVADAEELNALTAVYGVTYEAV